MLWSMCSRASLAKSRLDESRLPQGARRPVLKAPEDSSAPLAHGRNHSGAPSGGNNRVCSRVFRALKGDNHDVRACARELSIAQCSQDLR